MTSGRTVIHRNHVGVLLGAVLALAALSAGAHHGSSISYSTDNQWSTWATVTQFNYLNPHPTMTFDRTVEGGTVEHWVAELLTNPSTMARAGWTRQRTLDALAVGTRVKLTLATSRAGGFSGIVMGIQGEDGEPIAGRGGGSAAKDLDGVPGGLQPDGKEVLPGQELQ
jgi:hypothetical protein